MLEAQYAVMRAVVPLHRALQEAGQIEVSTTPFYHPILPLIHDTDLAAAGEPDMPRPSRFQAPEDARAQIEKAVDFYVKRFALSPKGMWPAEGAIGQSVVDHFTHSGIRWIASDQGVLARSGRWGYRADDPNVRCQPYRAEGREGAVSIFFRDRELSDAIGFKYRSFADQTAAARSFISEIKERLAARVTDHANRVVTVALDGENAWGSYPHAARPFLHALYQALSDDPEIKTVTFNEYLDGNAGRAVPAHPPESLPKVHDLFHGSWIDAWGSSPGADLGTWIGEPEENQAWELLKAARESLRTDGATPQSHAQAFEALYAAEGSDWFWWFGSDHDSGYDDVFDQLYRGHLRAVYLSSGRQPPAVLATSLTQRAVVWTFARPVSSIKLGERLVIRTNCAGVARWSVDAGRTHQETPMARAGGVMAGLHSYSALLGPFQGGVTGVEFVFRCSECRCEADKSCCGARRHRVEVIGP